MRIVSGEFRGRVIKSPDEKTTRPTTDRVRESMFSSITSRLGDLDGIAVLDAFCGSGALGIEALSRGAGRCLAYERDAAARKVIQGNYASLGLKAPRVTLKSGDVIEAASRPLHAGCPFDLVLLDPPYAMPAGEVKAFLERLHANGDLAQGACVVYEHALDTRKGVTELFADDGVFVMDGQKKYGKIGVTYLEYKGA